MDISLPILLFIPEAARYAIATALGLGVVITALYYMLAHALQHAPLHAMAKEELAALILTAMILLLWIGSGVTIDPFVSALVASAAPPGFSETLRMNDLSTSHLELAMASLDILFHKLKEMYTSMYLFEALIGFLSTISFPMGSPMPGPVIISFSLMPFDGLQLLSNAHTMIVESIGQLMTVVWAKQFVVMFARDVIPIIFLPLGLVFRAIPFLRTTGSSIIAICFAGYFVLPFAILLSNMMIFDIYEPSEFIYAPQEMGPYKTELAETGVQGEIDKSREGGNEIIKLFNAPSVTSSATSEDACAGNAVVVALCSAGNVVVGIGKGIYDFGSQMFKIWSFMMGMTGDFLSAFANPLLPSSATAGLYYFVIDAVVSHGQFLVLIVLTSLFEIIFTITMYRNIAMAIGGELEIAGLTKLV